MVHGLVKERLTGAVLLVALIVLLVPELLQGPIRPAPQARGPESAAEEAPLKSVTISLADDTRTGGGAQPAQTPSPAAPAAEPAGAAARPPPAAAAGAAPMAPPAAPPPAATQPIAAAPPASQPVPKSTTGGFVVQLGSFANRANADRLAQQVRARGFPVLVSRGNKGKHLYRVQVGPAHDHAGAEQLLTRLRATGHGGPIIPQ
jgi:DedD protein